MKQLTAYIECNRTGYYSIFIVEDMPFGAYGFGYSIEEAKSDFIETYKEMRQSHKERTGEDFEAEFSFVMDASALLRHLPQGLSLKEIAVRTRISVRRLMQYQAAKRQPRDERQALLRTIVATYEEERKS